jgi:ubiquinol-cytochrome c reductase cytochrome c1 subunit
MKNNSLFLVLPLVTLMSTTAMAAGEAIEYPKQHWPHKGITGTYDKAALQRGFQVYKEVCSACHAMKFMSYRNLAYMGYSPEEIKAIAAQYTVTDGPNDDGEMFERPAVPADRFKSPFANAKAARAANNGAYPPDMSLIVKSRKGGEDYIYALLHGYEEAPAGFQLQPGMNYNKYFAGHQIAMAKPLSDGQVTYSDGTAASLDQASRDLAQFLAFASEPHADERKQMGLKVILFLLAFAGIMYASKKRVWQKLRK